MTITIELKPEIEKQLAEKAERNGLNIKTYIEVLIEENVNANRNASPKNISNSAAVNERLAAFNKLIGNRQNGGEPFLSDEATRRESIYEDRF